MSTSTDSFIPLASPGASPGQREEFRVLVAPSPEKARSLRDSMPTAVGVAADHSQPGKCQPRVTLQKDGDQIIGIQVQCCCGQIIDLKCSYTDSPASSSPG